MNIAITGVKGIPARCGGLETCAEETAIRFARSHRVTVYCRRQDMENEAGEYRGVILKTKGSIPTKRLDTLSHTFLSVIDIMRDPEIDLVHLYNIANAVFIPLLKARGKKVVVTVDGSERKKVKWGILTRAFYRFSKYIGAKTADAVIADSNAAARYYRDKFAIESIHIPYGASIDEEVDESILERFNLKPREYLLFAGRLAPEKGVHNLIAAYNKVNTGLPLVIVGGDYKHREYIKSLVHSAGENVRFLGFVYGPGYQALNRFAYAFVTASQLEGTSPALVSAMAAGNCVIVNGIDENRETCGGAGIYFKENDVDDLARKIEMVIEDGRLAEDYRNKSLKHARTNFGWEAVADRYLALFAKLLGAEGIKVESREESRTIS